jgi:creatinine amidohydrolase/Fe(II)-dependent formamide hydrolase-like protein
VKLDKVKPDYAPAQGREFLDYTGIAGVCPDGHWGAPSKASAEQGQENLKQAAKRAVEYIRQTFADFDRLEGERKSRLGR